LTKFRSFVEEERITKEQPPVILGIAVINVALSEFYLFEKKG
jgi:hypothetical protein